MILVTGATGRIGRRVTEQLVSAGHDVRVLVRDEEKARRLLPVDSIDIIVGDLADEDVTNVAVEGIDGVLLVSSVAENQVVLQRNIVKSLNAAKPYIVKISGLGTALNSPIDSGRWHAQTEMEIAAAGIPYTFLRPLFLMQNLAFQLQSAKQQGVIKAAVGNAKIAMIDANDIAEVVVRLMEDHSLYRNQSITPTTHRSISYAEIAKTLSNLFGTDVSYERQSLQQIETALAASSQPDWHTRIVMQFNEAFIAGMGDEANRTVSHILGREPTTVEEYLKRAVSGTEIDESSNPFPS